MKAFKKAILNFLKINKNIILFFKNPNVFSMDSKNILKNNCVIFNELKIVVQFPRKYGHP